jgi:catechol 2,3-dioxygenase
MALPIQSEQAISIDPDTVIGKVALTVSDLARSRDFYKRAIGLQAADGADGAIVLSAADGHPLVELHGDSSAPKLDRRASGLYHLAILLPTRLDLAFALARLAEARWPLDGASDHLVSEALYLSDPDGHGIEIYRDRPREQWRQTDGRLEMATLPLDLRDILGELSQATERQPNAPAGTTIGHVHLQVADIPEAEAFYHGVLGFDVMVRSYPGALFVSAGGYHHHLGLNTWQSLRSGAPSPRIDRASQLRGPATRPRSARGRPRPSPRGRGTDRSNGRRHACPRSVGQRRRADRALTQPTQGSSLRFNLPATWRSGYAAACKAVYTGSIPVVASLSLENAGVPVRVARSASRRRFRHRLAAEAAALVQPTLGVRVVACGIAARDEIN